MNEINSFQNPAHLCIHNSSCEKRNQFDEIQSIITVNDINIKLNIENVKGVGIEGLPLNKTNDGFLKIHVADKFSLRGEVAIETN